MLPRFLASKRHGQPLAAGPATLHPEDLFTSLLSRERKRAERSRRPFSLMLVEMSEAVQSRLGGPGQVATALASSTREIDILGWYTTGSVLGVILTEIGDADIKTVRDAILDRVRTALHSIFGPEWTTQVHISFHVFPEDTLKAGRPADPTLYRDLTSGNGSKKAARHMKRAIDILGSTAALIVLAPVLLVVAVAIKLTSEGPVLFRQDRIGQYGKWFTFLKFRSMYCGSDPRIHQEYIKRYIAGGGDCKQADGNGGAYKLTKDPRVTPIGKFLRRTSLDEFPQFFNVLRGEMSLVGPRPPIPYEIEEYDLWHRRRFLEVKPGITGLWQVKGRSKLKFDEMVRLDLRYAKDWSLGLDLRILLKTPRAVLFGKDAF
jgi:lipopolysaccharide/colanic/teichoic acid biosynthesis glycosyltransferase